MLILLYASREWCIVQVLVVGFSSTICHEHKGKTINPTIVSEIAKDIKNLFGFDFCFITIKTTVFEIAADIAPYQIPLRIYRKDSLRCIKRINFHVGSKITFFGDYKPLFVKFL